MSTLAVDSWVAHLPSCSTPCKHDHPEARRRESKFDGLAQRVAHCQTELIKPHTIMPARELGGKLCDEVPLVLVCVADEEVVVEVVGSGQTRT